MPTTLPNCDCLCLYLATWFTHALWGKVWCLTFTSIIGRPNWQPALSASRTDVQFAVCWWHHCRSQFLTPVLTRQAVSCSCLMRCFSISDKNNWLLMFIGFFIIIDVQWSSCCSRITWGALTMHILGSLSQKINRTCMWPRHLHFTNTLQVHRKCLVVLWDTRTYTASDKCTIRFNV